MNNYLAMAKIGYFQAYALVEAKYEEEAHKIMFEHYSKLYPDLKESDVEVLPMSEIEYKNGVFEIARTD